MSPYVTIGEDDHRAATPRRNDGLGYRKGHEDGDENGEPHRHGLTKYEGPDAWQRR